MSVEFKKPVPRPDQLSAPFWTAASSHQLVVQRCGHCGRLALPPVVICPACLSPEAAFSFEPVGGAGILRTWTIMRDAFLPAFRGDIPWVVGEAELVDAPGVRLLARMADGPDAPLRAGAPVVIRFEDIGDGMALPVLALQGD